ncbi:MAG: peptide chain release factor N(5)-glutamine methyltransferase [Kineosporiaceae bacterium]
MESRQADLDRAVRDAAAVLAGAGIESASTDAEVLAAHVLGVNRAEAARQRALGRTLTVPQSAAFRDLVHDRARRIPLQHLTGRAHLCGVTVDVGPGVFVPRPETEVTVRHALDAVLAAHAPGRAVRVVDLCTGSAVIAVAIAAEAGSAGVDIRVVGVEVSPEAVAWARRNAERHGGGRVEVREGDVARACDDLCADLEGRTDVVVANPPYVPDGAEPTDPEARDHDPALALFGGPDGTAVVAQVARTAARLLRPGGTVVVEHGEAQGPAVSRLLAASGLTGGRTHRDLTGRPRVTVARGDG